MVPPDGSVPAEGDTPAGARAPSPLVDRLDLFLITIDRWRDRPVTLAAGVALALAVSGLGWWLGRPAPPGPVDELIPRATTAPGNTGEPAASPSGPASGAGSGPGVPSAHSGPEAGGGGPGPGGVDGGTVLVHVAGAVAAPGLVEVPVGARIHDAVLAAGGAQDGADLHQLNLAAPVVDGMQIRVPFPGETVTHPAGSVGSAGTTGPGSGETGSGLLAPVDVNRASASELERLPGIGPALSQAIVEWRQEHGPFLTPDGLLAVPGIGPAKLAGLIDQVMV